MKRQILAIDPQEVGISDTLSLSEAQTSHWLSQAPPLPLRINQQTAGKYVESREAESSQDDLRHLIESHLHENDPSNISVLVGANTDPFHPFGPQSHQCLEIIEMLRNYPLHLLVIRTRSPLAVLAAPLLRTWQGAAGVQLFLDTPDDMQNELCALHLPRPSERLRAARALHEIGIPVSLRIIPLASSRITGDDLSLWADRLIQSSLPLHLSPPTDVIANRFSDQTTRRPYPGCIDWSQSVRAYNTLRNLLITRAPAQLIEGKISCSIDASNSSAIFYGGAAS